MYICLDRYILRDKLTFLMFNGNLYVNILRNVKNVNIVLHNHIKWLYKIGYMYLFIYLFIFLLVHVLVVTNKILYTQINKKKLNIFLVKKVIKKKQTLVKCHKHIYVEFT